MNHDNHIVSCARLSQIQGRFLIFFTSYKNSNNCMKVNVKITKFRSNKYLTECVCLNLFSYKRLSKVSSQNLKEFFRQEKQAYIRGIISY